MEACPVCGQPLEPFRAKLVCRTPGCGFMESCCDGGWMSGGGERVALGPVSRPSPESALGPVSRPSPDDSSTDPAPQQSLSRDRHNG